MNLITTTKTTIVGTQMSSNKYTDQWGRYHDKPTDGITPSSNNGWIYTAYAKKAGLPINYDTLLECAHECYVPEPKPHFVRSPGVATPPISRDEILGLAYLDIINIVDDGYGAWNFSPYEFPKFSLVKLVKQLLEAKGKHRNYFWQNNLDQIYRFAFSVPVQDRDFMIQCFGLFKWYKPSHLFYRVVAKLDSMFGGEPNGIRYLKYGKSYEAMLQEFPQDHPLRSAK